MFTQQWGTGYLAAISFWFVGLFSLVLLPWCDRPRRLQQQGLYWKSLLFGCALVAIQAACLVYSISTFKDAAGINVVYSLRGLWGVVFSLALAKYFGGNEATMTRKVKIWRVVGAGLLVAAVMIAVIGTQNN